MTEEEKPQPLRSRGGCWFRAGGSVVHLGVERAFQAQRKAHPAFVVADIAAFADLLTRAGYVVTWDASLPDRQRFYTSDPFGNRIELIRDGDGFTQR
jgi:hypothetical protein